MGQENLTNGQGDERSDGGMFDDPSAAIRADGTPAAALTGELLTPRSALQIMLDSFGECRTESSIFKKWVEAFHTLISNPPSRDDPQYDSRLDREDIYGQNVYFDWMPIWDRIKGSIDDSGPVNMNAWNPTEEFVKKLNAMPRSKKHRTGGAGREGNVVLYYNSEGQTVSAAKYYQETYIPGEGLKGHKLSSDLPSSEMKNPAEAAQDIARKYLGKMGKLFPDQPSRDQEKLHPWIRELRLRMRLQSAFPHSPEVLARITELGFTNMFNHLRTITPFNNGKNERALAEELIAINRKAQVSSVMEVIVPNAKFSDLTATQMQSAISQWGTFLHEMAEIGMINTDKPHADIVLDSSQVHVRTYDMGAVSVISPDRKMEVMSTMHPGLYDSASALLSKIDHLEKSLKEKVQTRTAEQGLVVEVSSLLRIIKESQIHNPTILAKAEKISASISSVEEHDADRDRLVIAKSCEEIRNEIRKYLDYVLETHERGKSHSESLAPIIQAFGLPDLLGSTDKAKAVQEFEAVFLTRDAGAVIPFLDVLEACLIGNEDRYAVLIDIFFKASESMKLRGIDLSHDQETLSRWRTIRGAITGESAQYSPHDTSREQDNPPSGGGIPITQAGSREDRPGIAETEIMSVQKSVQDLVAAMEVKLDTAQRQLDEISDGQVRRITELERQLAASETAKSHLLLTLGELSASTRQYIENIQKHIRTLEESIASLESAREVSLEESSLKDKRILDLEQELAQLQEHEAKLQAQLLTTQENVTSQPSVSVASAPEVQEKLSGEDLAEKLLREHQTIGQVIEVLAKERRFGYVEAPRMVLRALRTMGEREIGDIMEQYLEDHDLQSKYSSMREKISARAGDPNTLSDYARILNGRQSYDRKHHAISFSDLDAKVEQLWNRLKDWNIPKKQT